MSLDEAILIAAMSGKKLSPKIMPSVNYKHWISYDDLKRCDICEDHHGKIWKIKEIPFPRPPVHPRCRCRIELMNAITAGTATIHSIEGADWALKYMNHLPNYYISRSEAKFKGWSPKLGNLNTICPHQMIGGTIYYNSDGHLPTKPGRIWREADINYQNGYRNDQRIVYSNDGLIFVTYDHYMTFYEII